MKKSIPAEMEAVGLARFYYLDDTEWAIHMAEINPEDPGDVRIAKATAVLLGGYKIGNRLGNARESSVLKKYIRFLLGT